MDEFVIRLFVCITYAAKTNCQNITSIKPALLGTKHYVILASWPPSFPTGDAAETKAS